LILPEKELDDTRKHPAEDFENKKLFGILKEAYALMTDIED
jgi:hypothetical protein